MYGQADVSWNELHADYPYLFTKKGKYIGDDDYKVIARNQEMDLEFWDEHPIYKQEVEPSKIEYYQQCVQLFLYENEEEGEE